MSAIREVDVALGARRYPIHIGAGLLDDGELLRRFVRGKHVLVISDANVAPHYLSKVSTALQGLTQRNLILPPGEQEKTLARFAEVMSALSEMGASRDATLIALGGGVVGDLTGFAAACWMRGVRFVQLPTSLLAMVDSSVGGKTAVDLPAGKNLVGAFHQPSGVIADINTLATLPNRELQAGFAEVIKYGALGDSDFFAWLEAHADALLAADADAIGQAIERCCRHKAGIVARDETEQGERALLNFGHTFGHAIEVEAGFGTVLHGEAVAIGMACAARLSADLGRASAADSTRLIQLLVRFGLPTNLPSGLQPSRLLAAMRLDKKAVSGQVRLILWRGVGSAEIVDGVSDADVLNVLGD
ncbi:MAG: 3-dehydroquinate synthase [Pseudomarimonas sp.]